MRRLHTPIGGEGVTESGDAEEEDSTDADARDVRELVARCLSTMNARMAEYTRKEFSGVVWDTLTLYLAQLLAAWEQGSAASTANPAANTTTVAMVTAEDRESVSRETWEAAMESVARILIVWVRVKKGARVISTDPLYAAVESLTGVKYRTEMVTVQQQQTPGKRCVVEEYLTRCCMALRGLLLHNRFRLAFRVADRGRMGIGDLGVLLFAVFRTIACSWWIPLIIAACMRSPLI